MSAGLKRSAGAPVIDATPVLAFLAQDGDGSFSVSDGKANKANGGDGGSVPQPVADALARLERALAALESGVDHHLTNHVDNRAAAAEVQRLNADRARIARSLDESEARSGRLDEANREVSRRLVGVMESVRTVLDR